MTGSPRARHCESPNLDGYWVCVVVVEVAGTAGTAGVVVVVLVVVVGVVQPDSDDAMTTAAKQAMISFFISIIFCLFYSYVITPSALHKLWGVTLPHARRS